MTKLTFPKSVPIKGRVRICLELVLSQKIKDQIIIDVGSSFGWLEKEIIKHKPKKVIGVEPSEEAVLFAKQNIKGVDFMVGSANHLDTQSNIADIVILFDVIEHIPKNTEGLVLKEINRTLKIQGTLLLSTPNDNFFARILDPAWYFGHRHYSKQTISKMLEKAGFEIKHITSKGSIFSSLYLFWFYIAKRLTKDVQPRSDFLEKLDDQGYDSGTITDIFLVAKKVK